MLYPNQRKITRLEFLRIFGVSSVPFLVPELLLTGFTAKSSCSITKGNISVRTLIKPDVIQLGSGEHFGSILVFPENASITDVDVLSVECEGAPVVDSMLSSNDRSIIFLYSSNDLRDNLPGGYSVEFTVHGQLNDGTPFEGSDAVVVIGASQGVIYHTSTRKRKSCRACKGHAANKIFTSREAADMNRAHRGCNCHIVKEAINWQDYVEAFGGVSRGGKTIYDKRWGWPPQLPVGVSK